MDSMDSIVQAEVGRRIDTGRKWIDGSVIYRKLLSIGALPATAAKNVPHGEEIALDKMARVSFFSAGDGTDFVSPGANPTIGIDDTNVVVTTTSDLSTYTGYVEIEFCL